jgi:hypothetical protein
MGKRDNEQLGAYLIDRMRGEQCTPLPHHPEAAEMASTADAAASGYARLDATGDEEGSKYALMRHIERDAAAREDRRLGRHWLGSFATATVCTVVFAGLVLGAYIFGFQQGTVTAARPSDHELVPVNVTSGKAPGNVEVPPYPGADENPVLVNGLPPHDYGDLGTALEARFADIRATAIRNGADDADANSQTDYLRSAAEDLLSAHALYDRDKRIGGLSVVVERLARMDRKYPRNELTVLGVMWAADIAREEMGDLSRAEVLYADAGRLCDSILKSREGSAIDQAYLRAVRNEASCNYSIVKDLRERGAALFAFPSAGEEGTPSGSPSQ